MIKFDVVKSTAMRIVRGFIASGIASAIITYCLSYLSSLEQSALVVLFTGIMLGLDKYIRTVINK